MKFLPGQQIALRGLAALIGEEVPSRDVADVHDVDRPVDVAGDPAQQKTADERVGRPARVGIVGPEDERGIDDDDGQPLRRRPHRDELGVVLRVDVGDAEPSHGERVVLIDRLPRLRGAHRARARGEHRALDAGAQGLLEDVPRTPDVDVEDADPVPAPHRRRSGDVEDALDAAHRPSHRVAIGDVALGALPLHSCERLGVAAIADQQPELVASTGQLPGDVDAHEARPTGDERLPHSVRMLESLNALDRGGRRHDLLSPA